MNLIKKLFGIGLPVFLAASCSSPDANHTFDAGIAHEDLKHHITFFSSEKLIDRETGTAGEARAAAYIASRLEEFGLSPAGDEGTYFQEFNVDIPGTGQRRIARNIIGISTGISEPETYIVIGTDYDQSAPAHSASASPFFKTDSLKDNSSAIAGMLELADYFSEFPTQKSLVFVAFSGSRLEQTGARYFTGHPAFSLEKTLAMLNMGSVNLSKNDTLQIEGSQSSGSWEKLIDQSAGDFQNIRLAFRDQAREYEHPFYGEKVPLLRFSAVEERSPGQNFEEEANVIKFIKRLVINIDSLPESELKFSDIKYQK